MKLSGIIVSSAYDCSMSPITIKRTISSVPFAGRYRFADFALSNMTNSGICSIAIVTGENYRSLSDHIGGGSEWDLARKGTNLFVFPPDDCNVPKSESLTVCRDFIRKTPNPYILLCDSRVICNINYEDALKSHIQSGANVTAICNSIVNEYELTAYDVIVKTENGTVTDISVGFTKGKEYLHSMGMYIVSKEHLLENIINHSSNASYSFERDMLIPGFFSGKLRVNPFEFKGTVLRNKNMTAYFKNSFLLSDSTIREEIFSKDRPIRTKARDSSPSVIHKGAHIADSTVADGCSIYGKVHNSILFRDVVIEEGASVSHSILMQGTRVCKDASVNYTITDKNVYISRGSCLWGAPMSPVLIQKGESV